MSNFLNPEAGVIVWSLIKKAQTTWISNCLFGELLTKTEEVAFIRGDKARGTLVFQLKDGSNFIAEEQMNNCLRISNFESGYNNHFKYNELRITAEKLN